MTVQCATCEGSGKKPILICTYGHYTIWGGAPGVSWEGETCNYRFLCGAKLKGYGRDGPCPGCSTQQEVTSNAD